jgi:cytochrome c-type biogenesis protein CcmH/NrfF
MMRIMKQKLFGFALAAMSFLMFPAMLLAQEEDSKIYDARLENYGANVTLENSSTALLWLLLVVLGAVCVGVMFKNAKRTHLD